MTQPPLSERVDAPAELHPTPVAGVTWRPVTQDDIDAVVELMGAMASVDHPDWAETREDVEPEFTRSWVDVGRDGLAGEIDGALVAFGLVIAPPDPETIVRSILEGGVHPAFRRRGIGRSLLAWQDGRARQQLAASDEELPGWIYAATEDRNEGANRLFAGAGFSVERYYWQLERVLSEPIPELRLPVPLRLANLTPELSEATRLAKNAAFRDH